MKNKMENEIDKVVRKYRKQFFNLYAHMDTFKGDTYFPTDIQNYDYVVLKSIENITEDEIICLSDTCLNSPDDINNLSSRDTDFLRGKGFLVPFMGFSCDALIRYRWVKYEE